MIATSRLRLIPATESTLTAELAGHEQLAGHLSITVPENWPPELYDRQATEYTLNCLRQHPDSPDWWLYYIVLDTAEEPVLAGTAGYKGPPDTDGSVELGYGVLAQFQRRGIATEASRALIGLAFRHPGVRRVIAETLPGLGASIAVMTNCGMRPVEGSSAEGVIRYALERKDFETSGGAS